MEVDVQKIIKGIGKQLKGLRKLKGYNQVDVMKITGISMKTLSSFENGKNVRLDTLVKLLRLYGKLDILENIHNKEFPTDINQWTKEITQSKARKRLLKNMDK